MYDSLYEPFIDDVDVVVHADHPTLNRRVAEMLAAGERIDVLSTHGKYTPSQAAWLRPLDALLDASTIATLAPRAVDLCRPRGALLCAPRNIDVRTLWWRTDRMDAAPDTWASLGTSAAVFGFTGRESGLFGLFFELVVGSGGSLFDAEGRPTMTGPEADAAVALLCDLAARAPVELPDWHYDDVDAALLDGRIDCAAAWPGGFGPIRASSVYGVLAPAPYFAGPSTRVSYSGVHAWAIRRRAATSTARSSSSRAFARSRCTSARPQPVASRRAPTCSPHSNPWTPPMPPGSRSPATRLITR